MILDSLSAVDAAVAVAVGCGCEAVAGLVEAVAVGNEVVVAVDLAANEQKLKLVIERGSCLACAYWTYWAIAAETGSVQGFQDGSRDCKTVASTSAEEGSWVAAEVGAARELVAAASFEVGPTVVAVRSKIETAPLILE